ncbi:MAG: PAS domain S-box protein, partial [Methanolinea sp.]
MEKWSRVVPSVFDRKDFWTVVLALTTVFAFLMNFYGMERDLLALTSHLFYIPIVIAAYWFPRNGVTATVAIAMTYLGTVYLSQYPDLGSITQATTYFYVFVAIGVIVASLSSTQKEQERRYRAIFESSEAGVFLVVNLKSGPVIEEVNQKGASLLGYRPGELAGRPFLDLFPLEEERKGIADGVSRGGSLSDHECHLRRKDGHVLHCLLAAGPLPVRRTVYTVVDITERKRAEEEVMASRRQYVDALNAMLDGIVLVGRKGEIVLLNSTLAHWLSLSGRENEIVGRDAGVAIPCLRGQAREAIRAVFETGESGRLTLSHVVRGKEHFFDTHIIP